MWEKRKVTACLAAPRQRDSGLMSDCSSVVTVPVHSDLASATPRSRGSNQHGKLASGVDKYLNMLVKYHYCRSWIGRAPCGTSLWWQWQYNSGKTKAPAGSSRHIYSTSFLVSVSSKTRYLLQITSLALPPTAAPAHRTSQISGSRGSPAGVYLDTILLLYTISLSTPFQWAKYSQKSAISRQSLR